MPPLRNAARDFLTATAALQIHVKKPDDFPLRVETVNEIKYFAFGDLAYKSTAEIDLDDFDGMGRKLTLDSILFFMKNQKGSHTQYLKEANHQKMQCISLVYSSVVKDFLDGKAPEQYTRLTTKQEAPQSLRKLLNQRSTAEPDEKRAKLDVIPTTSGPPNDVKMEKRAKSTPRKSVAEKRAQIQVLIEHRTKSLVDFEEHKKSELRRQPPSIPFIPNPSTSSGISSGGYKTSELRRQPPSNPVVTKPSTSSGAASEGHKKSDVMRQPPSNPVVTKPSTSSGAASEGHKPEMRPPPILPSVVQKPSGASGAKRTSRSPIIIVPAAMNTMINMYNAKDILEGSGYVSVDQKRKESNKKPTDLVIQRQKNGQTYNIRIIDNPEKMAPEDWDRVIGVFVMGVAQQFEGWKWNGNPTDNFARTAAFYLYSDLDKPLNQVTQLDVLKIPISSTKRHMDNLQFSQIWERMEKKVLLYKPYLAQCLGLSK
ncbi:hypothetical protein GCK72_015841 [Caenorhabditis remanei]|uniref:Cell division control protein 73 C-terminal domain-containing protein n=1 Tax=Caenorhabditis remanei TaxID=31234 RepID=A0A6A5GXP9_CAERE|nr:hypothetical protein GCK72_015841 [Caenorhabditis remanei]KAF1759374.1 hypothetical protein GCK72_015841 [Caenorhabditis remanei]